MNKNTEHAHKIGLAVYAGIVSLMAIGLVFVEVYIWLSMDAASVFDVAGSVFSSTRSLSISEGEAFRMLCSTSLFVLFACCSGNAMKSYLNTKPQ